ncbi:hypothetical protein Tco_0572405 [Tanacetum coccineum]
MYRDNIQEYVSQAAAANFNQGNTNSRPPMVANQIRPPGSLPSTGLLNPKEDLKGYFYQMCKFLLPVICWNGMECLALAGSWASIDLMPFSVEKKLNLPNLTPMCMTLELADRSISRPIGTLILGRCFLKTSRALIDVYEGELTLRVDNEAITYNLDQTLRYSVNYSDMTANRIDVVELACEEYSQEVLGFSDVIASGNPTPGYDPIVSNSSLTLIPFGDSDFLLLEEDDAFLALADDLTLPEIDESYYDPERDIFILEALLY